MALTNSPKTVRPPSALCPSSLRSASPRSLWSVDHYWIYQLKSVCWWKLGLGLMPELVVFASF